ncbi:MAG TPA: cytochrome c-type biogenesis protein [Acidimicrobiales bacterium]|nr:cytochrome c-type biogenesis protein [Acidimicrobiales bacterium]
MALVLGVALAVGASGHQGPPTPAQRAAAIEADVRCPSCEGISVAQSSAPTAAAIRTLVAADVAAGRSDGQIEAFLVGRYGPGILLRPSASGGVGLVWFVPMVAMSLALAGLGTVFWRRGRSAAVVVAVDDEDRRLVEGLLAQRRARRRPGANRETARRHG